ncbi:Formyltransferase [Trichodelitschia bisporula]|uniref:methionyl-tRNA formyltransferase n=1 Tax=Trichodelitschia bisporula TaxID=703511 RepID=A0A6G1HT96_9PEZI|nr:Formyltransferase [Trichodelitschia bisporula]
MNSISRLRASAWHQLQCRPQCRLSSSARISKPLRILFCGSDEFSTPSLLALHKEHQINPGLVEHLEVACRPPKRVGTGLKTLRSVAVDTLANSLSLPIHHVDNVNDILLPPGVNLIVTVSFGLLIPHRVLKDTEYGGLNIHPSLLPDLRGGAPLHHVLLKRRRFTGVSLQTLHPSRFDHGTVIAQTPEPWIPVPEKGTPGELLAMLAPLGADMLVQALRDGLHVPPVQPLKFDARMLDRMTDGYGPAWAPQVEKADSCVNWKSMPSSQVELLARVFGQVWDGETWARYHEMAGWSADGPRRRMIYEDVKVGEGEPPEGLEPGDLFELPGERVGVRTVDGYVVVGRSTVGGSKAGAGNRQLLLKMRVAKTRAEELAANSDATEAS